MASWVVAKNERFQLYENLVNAEGNVVGAIMRFYTSGPTYAWTSAGRIGPVSPLGCTLEGPERGFACDVAARSLVMKILRLLN